MATAEPRLSRRAAAQLLDVPPDADQATARQALLKLLPRSGWMVSRSHRHSVAVLGQSVPNVDVEQLAKEVESFAEKYWSLAPTERSQQWSALHAQCRPHSQVNARMLQLKAGLDVPAVVPSQCDPEIAEWAGLIQAVYVTPPLEKPERRWAIVTGHRHLKLKWQWEQLAQRLKAVQPRTAELGRDVLQGLIEAFDQTPIQPKKGPKWPTESEFSTAITFNQADPWSYHQTQAEPPKPKPEKKSKTFDIMIVVSIVSMFFGIMIKLGKTDQPPKQPKFFDPTTFPFVTPKDGDPKADAKKEKLRNILEAIREKHKNVEPPKLIGPQLPPDRPESPP